MAKAMFWRKCVSIMALVSLVATIGVAEVFELTYPIVFTQEPVEYPKIPTVWTFEGIHPKGSRIVRLDPEGGLEVLTPGFAAAMDPCVSYDGERILFAGKRHAEESWNIFEMRADGSEKRQLTRDLGDCTEPYYLASASVTPPTFEERVPWMTFVSTATNEFDERGQEAAPSLYVMNLAPITGRGTVLWRTTYNPGGVFSPTVMADGRVLFSTLNRGNVALMTVTWAGDNLNPFYGAHEGPALKTMASPLPDRTVVFVESDGTDADMGGRLVRVSLRRPLHSYEVLSRGEGRYRTPHDFSEGALGVSFATEDATYGIYLFDFETGGPGELVYDDPAWHDVDAIPIQPHPEPLARIPMLEFASVLDIQGFKDAAQLHCMSIYDSDRPEIQRLKPGQVKWARFVEGIPRKVGEEVPAPPSGDNNAWPPPSVQARILGEAPVEPDGSFFVNILGNAPFYIELLDESKEVLHRMQSWIWVRSGSQRGCIGCHENKELAPQNRATEALLKMQPTLLIRPTSSDSEPGE